MKNLSNLFVTIVLLFFLGSCRDFLDQKSNSKLSTLESIEENQALLDRTDNLKDFAISGELSTTDIYLTDQEYDSWQHEGDKRLYIWMPDNVSRTFTMGNDWSSTYSGVFRANTVLQSIKDNKLEGKEADNVKGQALVYRAARYLDASQIWCKAYDPKTAASDLGLPLRMDPDFNKPSIRHSLKETYDAILSDLHEAAPLLATKTQVPTRVTKSSALGLLARTYLFMGDYENALKYANEALTLSSELMDFNSLDAGADIPIPELNIEQVFGATLRYEPAIIVGKVSDELFSLYEEDDLRKSIFYHRNEFDEVLFKGVNMGFGASISGICTNELYLIAAECNARLGKPNEAMRELNALLVKRWKSGKYVQRSASRSDQALSYVILERRKELVLRGIRWADIKRYNRDGAGITLSRTVNNKTYTLPPNDPRFAIEIPEEVIVKTGMPQNPR